MFRRLRRGLIASMLAVVIALPGGARPAQAWDPAVIEKYIQLATAAYNLVKSVFGGGASDAAIRDAVAQIIAKIEESKVQILAHVDALATAEARACARHHVIEFADIERFDPITLQVWAQNVTGCVTLIESLLTVVTDKAQVDLLGLALNVAGPIALAARSKARFSTEALRLTLVRANNTDMSKLMPSCRTIRDVEGAVEYLCTAYNGDRALSTSWTYAVNAASAGTSRAVAQRALPLLNA